MLRSVGNTLSKNIFAKITKKIPWVMSGLYINEISFVRHFTLRRCGPTRVMTSSFTRFLDHTQWHTAVGRTPLDE